MIFDVSADAYYRFIGRYSEPLAAQSADLAGVRPGPRPGRRLLPAAPGEIAATAWAATGHP